MKYVTNITQKLIKYLTTVLCETEYYVFPVRTDIPPTDISKLNKVFFCFVCIGMPYKQLNRLVNVPALIINNPKIF